ncbi:SGNH/GDSL hydrolase family protein [Phytohabitans rumicis]|uniref:SGNH/GDSL hydrolase family protein n=1 Tax=Phytohabitans rumicis TaxID=1076125 RepID=UPI001C499B66|nr:SGNH/GDSL hydrolase family protein [Phytohabitans rumicis]
MWIVTAAAAVAAALGAASFQATAAATGAPPEPPRGAYVALGDSYTAGPGVPVQRPDTGICARSGANYPALVAQAVQPTEFRDVSCSGAVTGNVTGPMFGVPPQVDALSADTTLVTLGIGGNDAGFAPSVATCVVLSLLDQDGAPCAAHFTGDGVDRLAQAVDDVGPKVGAVLTEVRRRAPRATVLLVGYPSLLPESKADCAVFQPIAAGDVPYLRSLNQRLNQVLADQAAAAGAVFVDTFTSSEGHDGCQAPGVRFVEGVLGAEGAAPVHPNAAGMRDMADQVLAALDAPAR